jgi:hypothetical protein
MAVKHMQASAFKYSTNSALPSHHRQLGCPCLLLLLLRSADGTCDFGSLLLLPPPLLLNGKRAL